MGLIDIFKKNISDLGSENIASTASKVGSQFIKDLSGGKVEFSTKLADNVVLISGSSGGCGASTITSNLAYMASKKGLNVIVLDLNIMYPIQQTYLGIQQEIESADLFSYLCGNSTLGESIISNGAISLMYFNNRTLMDSIVCEDDIQITNFTSCIEKLRSLFDLVLVDCPIRLEHTLINTMLYISDHIYLVWDEGISSIANTERVRRNMALTGIDAYSKTSVILNKRTNLHYSMLPIDRLNVELVEILPFDTAIIESSLKGEIFCQKGASSSKNASSFYSSMQDLTDKVLQNGGYIE